MKHVALPRTLLLAAALAAPPAVALAAPGTSPPRGGQHAPGQAPAAASADGANAVSIGYDAVRPEHLDVVTGESVTWTNASARPHTVTAADGTFDSGRMTASDTFTRAFPTAGVVSYHCTLHPLIQGTVAVHDLLLRTPAQAAAPNRPFDLSGRSALPAGSAVSVEADSGTGFAPAASTTVGDDGRFTTRIVPTTTASYRAIAGASTSESVALTVLDRRIAVTARRVHGRVQLRADVTPASRGGRIVLQLYLRDRFGWWPVQTAKLQRGSGANFTLRPRRNLRARVRYTLADGVTALATSRIVRVGPAAKHHR